MYTIKKHRETGKWAVGRDVQIGSGFTVFETYGQGYIFADAYTAARMAEDLNSTITEEK